MPKSLQRAFTMVTWVDLITKRSVLKNCYGKHDLFYLPIFITKTYYVESIAINCKLILKALIFYFF